MNGIILIRFQDETNSRQDDFILCGIPRMQFVNLKANWNKCLIRNFLAKKTRK
jgi:hypothetical protein